MDQPWLRACKRLAVGQRARFRCCGRDAAGVLYNNPDAWEYYCHRCKQVGKEHKQYQRIQLQEEPRVQPSAPADAICISQAPAETQSFKKLDSWSAYMITSYEDAERYFGRKADKNRKIYNGMLKTYFYQFLGPKPPKRPKEPKQ